MQNKKLVDIVKEIIALREGSHEAFGSLYEYYYSAVYAFVLLHTKSKFTAEDIVQDIFMQIWKQREVISIDGSFKSLLFTMAKRRIIDALRKQINEPVFEDYIDYCNNLNMATDDMELNLFFDDYMKAVNVFKQKLPDRQQQVFEMSRKDGKSIREISLELNTSEQTVKNQLTSAIKKIRSLLSKADIK